MLVNSTLVTTFSQQCLSHSLLQIFMFLLKKCIHLSSRSNSGQFPKILDNWNTNFSMTFLKILNHQFKNSQENSSGSMTWLLFQGPTPDLIFIPQKMTILTRWLHNPDKIQIQTEPSDFIKEVQIIRVQVSSIEFKVLWIPVRACRSRPLLPSQPSRQGFHKPW